MKFILDSLILRFIRNAYKNNAYKKAIELLGCLMGVSRNIFKSRKIQTLQYGYMYTVTMYLEHALKKS